MNWKKSFNKSKLQNFCKNSDLMFFSSRTITKVFATQSDQRERSEKNHFIWNNKNKEPFLLTKTKQKLETQKFFNQCFDKGRLKNFVLWFLLNYGENKTVKLVEELKNVGFYYASKAGISLGIDDLKIPPKKAELIYEAEKQTLLTVSQYVRGEITGVERFQRLIDTWHRTSEVLKQEVIDYFEATDVLNPVYMMAFSGARGNISQVRQLVGMRGLMADPQGQIIDFPIRSNFREGLTLTEYIISSYGARKGIVDTALRTANAGYLTRRLVDVAQHVIISNFDCGTHRGIFLINMKEGNKTIHSLSQRIVGRILARDLVLSDYKKESNERENKKQETVESNFKTSVQELLARRNDEVTLDLAFEIGKNFDKVFVRSALTCETSNLICQLCYGWSLGQGNLVSIGEAVGVVAAQSIGEPGTQLTMRTFHTGGVFSGDISDQIRAPFNGIVEYLSAVPGKLIRTPEGKIAFLTKSEGSFIVLPHTNKNSNKKDNLKRYKIPAFTLLYIRNGQSVLEKEVIAQISTISRKGNATDHAELTIKAEYEGQFYSKSLGFREKFIGPKIKLTPTLLQSLKTDNVLNSDFDDFNFDFDDSKKGVQIEKVYEAFSWGYAWILSGKIYEANYQSNFFAQLGDSLNHHSCLTQNKWKLNNSQKVFYHIPKYFFNQFYHKTTRKEEKNTKNLGFITSQTPVLSLDLKQIIFKNKAYIFFLSDNLQFIKNTKSINQQKSNNILNPLLFDKLFFMKPLNTVYSTLDQESPFMLQCFQNTLTTSKSGYFFLETMSSYDKYSIEKDQDKNLLISKDNLPIKGVIVKIFKSDIKKTFTDLQNPLKTYLYLSPNSKYNLSDPSNPSHLSKRNYLLFEKHLNDFISSTRISILSSDLKNNKLPSKVYRTNCYFFENIKKNNFNPKLNYISVTKTNPLFLSTNRQGDYKMMNGHQNDFTTEQNIFVKVQFSSIQQKEQNKKANTVSQGALPRSGKPLLSKFYLREKLNHSVSNNHVETPSTNSTQNWTKEDYKKRKLFRVTTLKTLDSFCKTFIFLENNQENKNINKNKKIKNQNSIVGDKETKVKLVIKNLPLFLSIFKFSSTNNTVPQVVSLYKQDKKKNQGSFSFINFPKNLNNFKNQTKSSPKGLQSRRSQNVSEERFFNFFISKYINKTYNFSSIKLNTIIKDHNYFTLNNLVEDSFTQDNFISKTISISPKYLLKNNMVKTKTNKHKLINTSQLSQKFVGNLKTGWVYSVNSLLESTLISYHQKLVYPGQQNPLSISNHLPIFTECFFINNLFNIKTISSFSFLNKKLTNVSDQTFSYKSNGTQNQNINSITWIKNKKCRYNLSNFICTERTRLGLIIQPVHETNVESNKDFKINIYEKSTGKLSLKIKRNKIFSLIKKDRKNYKNQCLFYSKNNKKLLNKSFFKKTFSFKTNLLINKTLDSLYNWKKYQTLFYNKQQKTNMLLRKNLRNDFSVSCNPFLKNLISKKEFNKNPSLNNIKNNVSSFVNRSSLSVQSYLISSIESSDLFINYRAYSSSYSGLTSFDYSLYPLLFQSLSNFLSFYLSKTSLSLRVNNKNSFYYDNYFTLNSLNNSFSKNKVFQKINYLIPFMFEMPCFSYRKHERLKLEPLVDNSKTKLNKRNQEDLSYLKTNISNMQSKALTTKYQTILSKFKYSFKNSSISAKNFAITNYYSPFKGEIVYTHYPMGTKFHNKNLLENTISVETFDTTNNDPIFPPSKKDYSCMVLTKADLISYYLPSKNYQKMLNQVYNEESKKKYIIRDTLIKFLNMSESEEFLSGYNIQEKNAVGIKITSLNAGSPVSVNLPLLGDFFVYGDPISENKVIQSSGQIIHYNNQKVTLRRSQPIFISPKGLLRKFDGDFIDPKSPVITLSYERLKTGDIIQGIPKVEQFFEARTTKRGRLFRDSLPSLLKGLFKRYQTKLPQDLAVRQSFYKIQQIVVDGVQRVYKSQGVTIADKHLEIIVKQMTSKVRILDGSQTGFFAGEIVDLCFVEKINSFLIKKIIYEPLVLGITKASLEVDSFLSAASFQQTTRVLSKAAVYRKKDFLKGLKENVILGNLIPAGTGYLVYLDKFN